MGCNLCNQGLTPICIPASQFQPNVIQCPQIVGSGVENPLCDLLPTITSLPDFLINLPFLMLFVVSLPARFLYCLVYQFLINTDNIINFLIYYILYPAIDVITLPFLYFVLGFNNGLINNFNLPNEPYGFLNGCFVSQILEKVYEYLGDVFYVIGFAIGYFSTIFYRLYNLLLDLACYIAYLSFCISLGICIGFEVLGHHVGPPPTCVNRCIQPFGFLQGIICKFINCQCALGECPSVTLEIPIDLGCSPPSCGGNDVYPTCILYNLGNPVSQTNYTFIAPNITSEVSENLVTYTQPSESSETTSSEVSTSSEITSSEITSSETTSTEITSSESSEIIIPPNDPCYVVNELYYCQECLSENENCDLCVEVLNAIKEYGCSYPCCNYPCLISNACYLCSEYGETSEVKYENACYICSEVLSTCYPESNFSNLPCYQAINYYCNQCFDTNEQEYCDLCSSAIDTCIILNAMSECPVSENSSY